MYSISLTERQRQQYKPIFDAIEQACDEVGIEFFLVGAVARDITMAIHGLESPRVTRDLDIAVLIPEPTDYDRLKEKLLEKGQFAEVRNMPFTLKYAGDTVVDLLPFGGLEMDGQVLVNRGEAVAKLAVTGFAEVYEHGTQHVMLDEEFTFRVCDLPGMVVLKLIAYDDNFERVKDLTDIAFILKNYEAIIDQQLFDEHYDLLDGEISLEQAAARILGRHLRPILNSLAALYQRVTAILDRAIADGPEGPVARHIHSAQYQRKPLDYVITLLQQIRQGIDDTITTASTATDNTK
ncbi:putative nucleotidyltransferase [Spirosoma oryzae]|uniref:Putative nucleotidyltransferase n=1 Tax=Spirosoma oryzae TaxID=1469603 RepID=A0A2T0RME7_9BACT|nr:nucleotidyl transferase AbiEii/AbiGii toxin family protein [Spirosoma oryzae]PRY22292.1 putative nucleotidyltransferase [Spirosoma oryzae]